LREELEGAVSDDEVVEGFGVDLAPLALAAEADGEGRLAERALSA
jgi:hypothetical protein